MMDEENLRKNIATAFVLLKEQQTELFELQDQVAAMRDLMKEASPNFARMFSERVEEWRNRARGVRADTLARFDEIILQLRNG